MNTAITILHEDDDLLVLAKPAGVVVNEASSAVGETIQEWAREYLASLPTVSSKSWQQVVPQDFDEQYGTPEEIFVSRTGMVHRLDKETSGVLLWAKNPGAQVELLRQFRERVVEKTYECLVHGRVATESGEITAPIDRSSYNRQRFAVSVGGRPAITRYQVTAHYQLDFDRFVTAARQAHLFAGRPAAQLKEQLIEYTEYTYLKCQPKTGRTHQIRVHCQHLGHPLVGDELYQGRKRIKLDEIWCPRHFLHAASVTFNHPRTQEKVTFTAPLPDDLQQTLEWLTIT
jgi:23S rRNA pseudouridine1911/1915/1917 synthase